MLLEDAGDIRFDTASCADFIFTQAEGRSIAGTITELSIYALIAALMLYPVLQ